MLFRSDLRGFFALNNSYYYLESRINAGEVGAIEKMNAWVDEAYTKIEEVQKDLVENGPLYIPHTVESRPSGTLIISDDQRENWPMFQGNISNTGHVSAPGAQIGETLWKFPIALGWYCRPLIEGNRMYITSPGMRTICLCLDTTTGEVIWKSGQIHPKFGIYKYPVMMSTPISVGDTIVLREGNSHGGNEGQARNLVFIDKATGEVLSRSYAGHIDYRTQYAPVASNGDCIVYPFGIHDIYSMPPVCQNLNRLICADSTNQKIRWDINVGDIDILAESVLNTTTVFQGTTDRKSVV